MLLGALFYGALMKHFKTKAGTELPLMDLQGKEYLQVAHRLVWFREENPEWSIQTEVLAELQLVKAIVRNGAGCVMSTAHKAIGSKRYPVESAETGAVGRALAMCGFGTQFAGDELEEGDEIADAPIEPKKQQERRVQTQSKPVIKEASGITEQQFGRLEKTAKRTGWWPNKVNARLTLLGLPAASKLNFVQYNALIKDMETYPEPGSEVLKSN